MKTIAIVNRKGGVGKTATAQALGAGLSRRGFKVLYIDLDSQTNLTYSLQANADGISSYEVLTGTATAPAAIQHTPQGDIIPGAETLAAADTVITSVGKEYRLRKALDSIKTKYDYAIVDTPAALGTLTVNALTAADSAIIPVQADAYSLQGLSQLCAVIDAVREYCNHNLSINGILLTRYNGRAILSKDIQTSLQEIARQLSTRLYCTPIRECISIKEAQAQRQDIFAYAPRSNAASDYNAFVNDFLEKDV